MLILNRADVQRLLRTGSVAARLIDAVEAAHAELAAGVARQAVEAALPLPGTETVLLPMTAALGPGGAAGVKVLADAPANPDATGLTQRSTITLVDPVTGACRALLDGVEITRHRTAAASAVATRHLARADASTLGLIGAGAQARAHLEAIRAVRDIERVVIWNRTPLRARRLAEWCATGPSPIPVAVLDSPAAVTRAADILCTLTPSSEPIVSGRWFRPGLHVNAVGAPPRPDHREIDTEGVRRSVVVVDHRETALSRSGELCIPIREGAVAAGHVRADLGELAIGAHPGRTEDAQITLFDSVGLAIQDMAAATLLLAAAEEGGVGTTVDMDGVADVEVALSLPSAPSR